MNPKSAIQKGKDLENYVSDQIRSKGLDKKARRSIGSGSGTREKADIDTSLTLLGRNAGFECKHVSTISFRQFWIQTKKLESVGREPILIIKHTDEYYGDTKAVIYLDTLLELIKRSKEPKTLVADNREQKWAVSNLREACKKVLKHLEEK